MKSSAGYVPLTGYMSETRTASSLSLPLLLSSVGKIKSPLQRGGFRQIVALTAMYVGGYLLVSCKCPGTG